MEQYRFNHAHNELTEALKVTPAGRPECNEFHSSIALALCRCQIDRDDSNLDEAANLANSVITTFEKTRAAKLDPD